VAVLHHILGQSLFKEFARDLFDFLSRISFTVESPLETFLKYIAPEALNVLSNASPEPLYSPVLPDLPLIYLMKNVGYIHSMTLNDLHHALTPLARILIMRGESERGGLHARCECLGGRFHAIALQAGWEEGLGYAAEEGVLLVLVREHVGFVHCHYRHMQLPIWP